MRPALPPVVRPAGAGAGVHAVVAAAATAEFQGLRVHAYPAYVALGSNLQDPAAQLHAAFDELAQLADTRLVCRSALYGSRPMGPVQQPDFCNAVAGLLTALDPAALLGALRAIERRRGRERGGERWGPRVIDLDLLMHGERRSAGAGLTLPHPGIAQRNFVLLPWREFAPQVLVPGLGRVVELASRVPADGLWKIA
ncbi:MAG: 2-amino-4-hydroxy-6-hydroxymethyldihydropteridine diphosphokinase [Gammaproteobacteria bacterium]|nr:2-amino-4-hydroxy-6-hydroxymethyldihydropteridine diphosphokinase [Gammaproteobacteria bacterium]